MYDTEWSREYLEGKGTVKVSPDETIKQQVEKHPMQIAEIRRVLRRYDLSMRKRTGLIISNEDCPYEVCYRREWRFDINPEKYCSIEEVERKIKYELREEYINPMG